MRTFRLSLIAVAVLALAPAQLGAKSPAAVAGAPAAIAPAHERFILMEGGRNFRDLGGYRTRDGRVVRWGAVYRSGSLGRLTAAGEARLESLRPAAIIDLRTTDERRSDTNARLAVANSGYWTRDYGMSAGNLGKVMQNPAAGSAAQSRAYMLDAYRRMPSEQAAAYRELFARLVSGSGPVVFNCTAGKDRTGLASALVLTALGVPYATVRRDYLISNGAPGMESLSAALGAEGANPALRPLLRVEPEYLDTSFARIRHDYGSIDAYLRKELGVGPAELRKLRARLLR